jgi:hypothetical protein
MLIRHQRDQIRPGSVASMSGFDEPTLRSGLAGDKKYVRAAFTELRSAF